MQNLRHFSFGEFACKCCGQQAPNGMNPVLLQALDDLRELYGDCVMVSSAYRCEYNNFINGGVKNSQHLLGNAADIYVAGDYEDFYNLVVEMERFDGIGHYPEEEFVHVDMRNDGATPNCYRWEG